MPLPWSFPVAAATHDQETRMMPHALPCLRAGLLGAAILTALPAAAQSAPFLGQIMCGGFNFAPRGWARLDGQLLPISNNEALFALLGTNYGGDGHTTFGVPDMRGRMLMHDGAGPGLTPRTLGQKGGSETHTLGVNQMPAHTHTVAPRASSENGSLTNPTGAVPATRNLLRPYAPAPGDATMAASTSSAAGGNQPVAHLPPYIAINCFIATQGVFPPPP